MSAHTPGPWTLVVRPGDMTVGVESRALAAILGSPNGEKVANAHLIVAAPELADALEACVQVLAIQYATRQRNGGAGQQAFDKARAALRKAGRLP